MKAKIYNFSSWIDETNPDILKERFKKKLIQSNFKILDMIEYHFNPQGYSIVYLLAESHFAIHTFPEKKCTYIELSSCTKSQFDSFIFDYNNA